MRVQHLVKVVEKELGRPLGGDEYLTFGDPGREYARPLVTWKVDGDSMRRAQELGCDLIIHHESLLYPIPLLPVGPERPYLGWAVNADKLRRLAGAGLSTFRLHSSADELCVFSAFVRALGFLEIPPPDGRPVSYCRRLYRPPETVLGALAVRIKRIMGLSSVRCVGDPEARVERVGVPWGGMGLFVNIDFARQLMEMGADCLVCGETDNHAMCFAAEQGIPLIETSHELSENYGMEKLAGLLAGWLGTPVHYHPAACVWNLW